MRGSLRRAIPGVVMLHQRLWRRYTFFRNDAFEGCKPMAVVGFSGVGIAVCLGLLDFLAKLRGPLGPGEDTSIIQCYRHRKRVGFPEIGRASCRERVAIAEGRVPQRTTKKTR